MSQEARDERLGLTGLTPEERKQRVEEMTRILAERHQAAKRALEERRATRREAAATADGEQAAP